MNFYAALSLLSAVISIFLANFVFYHNSKSLENRLFALFCLTMAPWGFCEFMYRTATSYEIALFWTKMNLLVGFCPAVFMHFSLIFTKRSPRLIWPVMGVVYLGASLDALYESTRAVPEYAWWGYTYALDPNPLIQNFIFFYFLLATLIPCVVFYQYYRSTTESLRKSQTKWIIIAILIPNSMSILELFMTFIMNTRVPELTIVSMTWLSIVIVYASWRYELFQLNPTKAADQIVSQMADALVLLNAQGKVLLVNPSVELFTGYASRELCGEHISILFSERSTLFDQIIPKLLNHENLIHQESALQRKSGEEMIIEYSATIVEYGKKLSGVILTFTDITERKYAEQKIKTLNTRLSEKNKEMEQMIYMVSHDLRSPLTNIMGLTDLLESGIKDLSQVVAQETELKTLKATAQELVEEELNELFEYISSSTEKMSALIEGLLQIARISHQNIEYQPIDFQRMALEIKDTFNYRIKTLDVQLIIDDLPPCEGDPLMLNQVLSNLVDNALKYLDPSRAGEISISGERVDDRVIYRISDNGIGIPPDHFKTVFQVFNQEKSTNEGYGIGLSTLTKIIQKHHGEIWVESEVGVGSQFYFSIPITQGSQASALTS